MAADLEDRAETVLGLAAKAFSPDVVLTPYGPGRGLPLFIQPDTAKLYEDTEYAIAWLDDHRPLIEQMLVTAGAIVLRGFPIDRSIHFARFTEGYGSFEEGYVAGTADRSVIVDKVMSANSLRADLTIEIHQEMSYLPRYPKRIAFYCRMPAVSGGATMICDMREATARIDPVLFREVEKRGIRHVRNFRAPGSDPGHPVIGRFHKTWSEAFQTDEPAKAEASCRALGFEAKWCENGSLEAIYNTPGIVVHPRTGEKIWFNQVATTTVTPRNNPELYKLREEAFGNGKRPPFESSYGDGTDIPVELLDPVNPMMRELAVTFPWCHQDIMLVDNYIVGHGRTPFTGKRDIQVALLG
jgi:alpha-ketoglutarate-dependent taurine dioxygenase